MSDILKDFQRRYENNKEQEFTLQEYLELCRKDPLAYANAAERLLVAIGEPRLIDTSTDPVTSRLFSNKIIARYQAFSEFYGMDDAIEQIVGFLKHAAQGLEEVKQVLYLLGPVGGGKSSIAERLKDLMEKVPFYAIKGSPVHESPLGLFSYEEDAAILEEKYGIPKRHMRHIMSPWMVKRLHEFNGDISKFTVVKLYPSRLRQNDGSLLNTESYPARPAPIVAPSITSDNN